MSIYNMMMMWMLIQMIGTVKCAMARVDHSDAKSCVCPITAADHLFPAVIAVGAWIIFNWIAKKFWQTWRPQPSAETSKLSAKVLCTCPSEENDCTTIAVQETSTDDEIKNNSIASY